MEGDIPHLELGPVQEEDVLLIQAVIKLTCPSVLVELGYLNGFSTSKILEVMREDAHLTSYDNTVKHSLIKDKRFTFKNKSQTEVEEKDIDFIFFDASHDLDLNIETFKNLKLSNNAIIVIHDTGIWNEMIMDTGGYFVEEGYIHRPHEREFVKYLIKNGYNAVNLMTTKELRHGISIVQKVNF